jgi:hypothetical protein
MNDQQRVAMQMALEDLRAIWLDERASIVALREALAQEDKPHVVRDGGNWGMGPRYKCSACDEEFRSEHRAHWHCQNECKALAQPQEILGKDTCLSENQQGEWVDLTDDEIKTAYESWWETHDNHAFPIWVGAKAAIAKFKSKNTPPVVPQGEPVAEVIDYQTAAMIHEDKPLPYGTKLYTTPPVQREQQEPVACCVCGATENLHKDGWHGYRCNSDECVCL